jgi:hypothetical protein
MLTTPILVGYDVSEDMHNLSVLCIDCWTSEDGGTPLYEGDYWGAYECSCDTCGEDLNVDLTPP